MVNLSAFSKRIRSRTVAASALFLGGAFMMIVDFTTRFPTTQKGEFALIWAFAMALGGYFWYRSFELPAKEILQLAELRGGVLTVTEIATALDIKPDLACATLRHLAAHGLAQSCWEELERNLWEFPDVTKLPVTEAVRIATEHGGRIRLKDLVAKGHSVRAASETFELMAQKGLAKSDPSAEGGGVILSDGPQLTQE